MPDLQRRHYEHFATSIARARKRAAVHHAGTPAPDVLDNVLIPLIADELVETNPQFNRNRFIRACTAES